MACSKMINLKRKRRTRATKDLPFPVLVASDKGNNDWFYYTGYLHDNHIEIKHSGDIDRLYKMGFFGKGTLSRSKPEFNQRYRSANIPNSTGEIINARVMSRRSYIHRLNWALATAGKSICHKESDSSEEFWEDMEFTGSLDADSTKQKTEKHKDANSENDICTDKNMKLDASSELKVESANVLESSYRESKQELWEESQQELSEESQQELWEENEDFWNSDSIVTSTVEKKIGNSVLQESKDVWTTKQVSDLSTLGIAEMSNSEEKVHKNTNRFQITGNKTTTNLYGLNTDKETIILSEIDDCNREINRHGRNNCITGSAEQKDAEINTEFYDNKRTDSLVQTGTQNINKYEEDLEHERIDDIKTDEVTINVSAEFPRIQQKDAEKGISKDFKYVSASESDLDSLCKSDDDDGNLLVIEDSDSDVDHCKRRKSNRKRWRPVLKKDPLFVQENLHLSFEEAFFLSYGLGCLIVRDEHDKTPDLTEMWHTFSRRQKTFVPNYIAYHYYRSKGWVPKTGLKFGTDFLIYKEGPSFYHGSYSVIVKMVMEGSLIADPKYPDRDLSWTSLAGLNRLTEQVAKEVLICYVIRPNDLSEDDLMSPKCIPRFQVKEMLLSRWVSSQEREKRTEEIP